MRVNVCEQGMDLLEWETIYTINHCSCLSRNKLLYQSKRATLTEPYFLFQAHPDRILKHFSNESCMVHQKVLCQTLITMGNKIPIPNSILFPKPQTSYTAESISIYHKGKMFSAHQKTCSLFLPYLSKDGKSISQKALIYFHGNGEDVGLSIQWLEKMRNILKVNVFANEYPGYGIHWNKQASTGAMSDEGVLLYDFVHTLGFRHSDIVVVGRSIGSGPACSVAGRTQCETLVLISPFASMSNMVKQKTLFLQNLFHDSFPNSENIRKSKARLLVIHGQQDDVINVSNARMIQELYEKELVRVSGKFVYHKHSTHNNLCIRRDIIQPIGEFLGSEQPLMREYQPVRTVINNLVVKKSDENPGNSSCLS